MGVMKMGNTVPREGGLEPTSLAFGGQCATITPHMFPGITTIPMHHTCLCGSFA